MTRRIRWAIVGLILIAVAVGVFQQSRRKPSSPLVVIVSLVRHPLFDEVVNGIRSGLEQRNATSQQKFRIVELNANGEMDKLQALSNEALSMNPDVIIPVSTPVTLSVTKAAAASQRIVFSFVANPSDVGMDDNPQNMTGVSDQVDYPGVVDLIHELLPSAKRVGIIFNPAERNSQYGVEQTKLAANKKGMELVLVPVSGSTAVPDAARLLQGRVDVICVGSDNTVVSAMPGLVNATLPLKIPVVAGDSSSVRQGALGAVSADYDRVGRETAQIVLRLLDDPKLKPGSIDVVLIRGGSVVINLAAAEKLAFEFPSTVSLRGAQKFTSISD